MERLEDLEGRLNRESVDLKETVQELEKNKNDLEQRLEEAEGRVHHAQKSN